MIEYKNELDMKKTIIGCLILLLTSMLSSCEVMSAFAQGMAMPMYGGYNPSAYTGGQTGTMSSSSSTKECGRCHGSGKCQNCGGSGKVYDYGSASVSSKSKYTHNCGVCSGRGRCGACNGKGYI